MLGPVVRVLAPDEAIRYMSHRLFLLPLDVAAFFMLSLSGYGILGYPLWVCSGVGTFIHDLTFWDCSQMALLPPGVAGLLPYASVEGKHPNGQP